MILGIYSDLHANLPALHSMQAMAGAIDQWVALGDSVGLYPYVNEVLDWQRLNKVLYISGDHEDALLDRGDPLESFTGTESIRNQAKIITTDNLNTLSKLSKNCSIELDNLKIYFTHYLNNDTHISAKKYAIDLAQLEKQYRGFDFVFFGHTHLPSIIYGRNTIFINPGSAGFPIDIERRCSMISLDTCTGLFELVRYDYDGDELVNAIEASGYNQKLVSFIRNDHSWI